MGGKNSQHAGTGARRSQIIQAALECFLDKGFVDSTLEDIRARSGASTGSIYHHFKGKDDLAAAVYIEGIKNYQDGLLEALADLPAREGVCEIVRFHLSWVADNQMWAQFLFAMRHSDFMKSSQVSIEERNDFFLKKVSAWFRARVEAGELRRLPKNLYTSLIWGASQEYAKLWLAGPRKKSELEFAARELGEAAWEALKAKE